ncbi:MAG: hypothetical protein Q7R83_00285, partial [bacterium]|nr:hypothetical protein [bacterium]
MENRIFVQTEAGREAIESLGGVIREPLEHRCLMETGYMEPQDIPFCRWIGYGLGKGVTHPERNISV